MAKTKITLGDRVKDTISGFQGILVARTKWLNGCERLTIQPEKLNAGKCIDQETFDAKQVELVKAGVIEYTDPENGGPRPEPRRQPDAR
jgi:hypothetical protein